jgi:hypothetical protein
MGEVIAHLAMSLDGFIADPDDGRDELFGFYGSGDVAVKLGAGIPELHVSRKTADLLTAEVGNEGATVAGTRGPGRLSDPEVIEDRGVTHLRYRVRREG